MPNPKTTKVVSKTTCDGQPLDPEGYYFHRDNVGLRERDLYTPEQAALGVVQLSKICVVCQKPADLVCGRCSVIRYCSPECQKAHWKAHRPECISSSGFSPATNASRELRKAAFSIRDDPLLRFLFDLLYVNFKSVRDGSSDIIVKLSENKDRFLEDIDVNLSQNRDARKDQSKMNALLVSLKEMNGLPNIPVIFTYGNGIPLVAVFPINPYGNVFFITDPCRERLLALTSAFNCNLKTRVLAICSCRPMATQLVSGNARSPLSGVAPSPSEGNEEKKEVVSDETKESKKESEIDVFAVD